MKSKLDYLKYNRRRAPARGSYRLLPDRSRRWLPFVLLGIVVIAALIGLAAMLRTAATGNEQRAAGDGQTATGSRQLATGEQPAAVIAGAEATETALPPTVTPIPSATAIP